MSPGGRKGPPVLARALLARLLPEGDRHAVLGEVEELYEIQCGRKGVGPARRWYRIQVVLFAWELARHGRKRGVRAGRTRFEAALDRRTTKRGGVDMRKWLSEMSLAARRLMRAPGFTLVAVLTIGAGIGAFTSIFSLVEAVLLEPMPYDRPEELAWVWRDYVEADFPRGWLGGPDIAALAEHDDVFAGVVAFRTGALNLSGIAGENPSRVVAHYATPGLFELLGVTPYLGSESWRDDRGTEGPEVAVLAHDLWSTHFGADPGIVGRTIVLNDTPTEVVGVAPPDFRFVKHGSLSEPIGADLYMPLRVDLAQQNPGSGSYAALVRIRPDAHPDRVVAALDASAERTNAYFREGNGSPIRLWTVDLQSDLVAGIRTGLIALIASAGFLLLVLAANLATLLLGRAAAREHELGIRIALGAGKGRILSGVFAEGIVLAALGGTLGVALGWAGTRLVVALAPPELPRLGEVGVDPTVLGMALAVTGGMALVAGLTPALYALRTRVAGSLGEGSARSGRSARGVRLRSLLVTAQVALSLMLLVGAGLTARTFAGLLSEDPGFDAGNTLTFRVPLPGARYQGADLAAFHDELRTRLSALPGVTAVGASTALPLTMRTNQRGVSFPGAPGNTGDRDTDSPLTDNFRVTPNYFAAAGHRLIAGRDFIELDGDTTTFNIIIDDVLADRFFPDGGAVGSLAYLVGDTATVVGVVDQARLYTVRNDDRGQIYLPFQRFPTTSMSYAVRAAIAPPSLVPAARAIVRELDASVPLSEVRTLEEIVGGSLVEERLSLTLIAAFALGALLLAALGIYGVVSNSVVRRRQEIGVRMALGATGDSVVRLVLRQGLALSAAGAALGLFTALAATRVFERLLVEFDTGSPTVFIGVALGLIAVASFASYLPARRATRIDPLEALRPE